MPRSPRLQLARLLTLLTIAATGALAAESLDRQARTDVRIDTGALRGVVTGATVAFKGIPYAAPPVGELRWHAPQPAAAWDGVRTADHYGTICMQMLDAARAAQLPAASEDCLTLNVWTPRDTPARRLPVMVWIHGGSFNSGSAAAPVYDGTSLAQRGVVVVTLNYRLGRFGFFAHPALSAETPQGPLANYALLDMIAALKWVSRNIAAFGGDPRNVTIFGESSGAAAVNRLMIAPSARDLFHRAISQSGNGREFTPRLHDRNPDGLLSAEESGKAFAASMGVAPYDVAALRAIPADRIVDAGNRTAIEGGPVIDGVLLTMEVADAFQRGLQAPVPFIVGSTSLELPTATSAFEQRFATVVNVSTANRAAIAKAYASEDQFRERVLSDIVFREPARFLAAAHTRAGHPSYLYRFGVLSSSARATYRGAPHASELAYLFGTLDAQRWKADSADADHGATMAAYWLDFARRGDPNAPNRPPWPRYSPDDDFIIDFTNDGPVRRKTPDARVLDAIAGTYTHRP